MCVCVCVCVCVSIGSKWGGIRRLDGTMNKIYYESGWL